MTNQNPFTEIDQRLQRIENLMARFTTKDPEPKQTNFVDIKTASEIIGLPVPTIYKRIKEIPRYKHGRSLMFRPDELIQWVESFRLSTDDEIQEQAIENLARVVK